MSDSQKISQDLQVINKEGFHLRVASMISKTALQYEDNIFLSKGSYKADCKSCFDLLAIMAPCGSVLTLDVEGPNAEKIVGEITQMFQTKFGEDEFARSAE